MCWNEENLLKQLNILMFYPEFHEFHLSLMLCGDLDID